MVTVLDNSTLGTELTITTPLPDSFEEDEGAVEFHLFIAVISVALAAFICFGNAMTLLAIFRNSLLQTTPSLCIGSLAVADSLVGLLLLVQGIGDFMLSENFLEHNEQLCLSLMSLLFVSVTASMLSMVLVAVDRYIYISYSLHYTTLVTRTRSSSLIALIWVIAMVYGTIPAYTSHYQSAQGCEPTHSFSRTYMIIVHPTLFFSVCAVTLFLYCQIGRTAVRQRKLINAQKGNIFCADKKIKSNFSRSSLKLVKLLMAVFGFFFISWCPLLVVSILEYTIHVNHHVLTVCGLLAVMNSGINFLMLSFMNADFRNEFRKILCSRCGARKVYPIAPSTISKSFPD
uniref:G-protein coupled receptors family 1 profile domain-containing protein n=1 Tax=Biomphalaria glabrata TaxID=6526 RepID=A0A2C9KUE2_BIOGL